VMKGFKALIREQGLFEGLDMAYPMRGISSRDD
jgi:hypothetical protein